MKLKLVVASMSILGLVSCPAFADYQAKNNKHHPSYHKSMSSDPVEHHDYKDMGPMPTQPVADVCTISHSSMLMTQMSQNLGRSMPNPCNPGWFNRVRLAGGINFDFGKWGNRSANFQGVNYQHFSLNDAYLNIGATVNDWTSAFASLSYSNPTISDNTFGWFTLNPFINPFFNPLVNPGSGFGFTNFFFPGYRAQYSSVYNGLSTSHIRNRTLDLEQAYFTVGGNCEMPFFIQLGKQFQDFSRYEIHPITRTLTQVLSEMLATSAEIGFVANGFNGSIYVFDDPISKFNHSRSTTNYGAAIGYDYPSDALGFDVGAAYIRNLMGAQDVADAVNFFTFGNGFHHRVAAYALYADVNSGPFVIGARFTRAIDNFSPLDLPEGGLSDVNFFGFVNADAAGAKPWAATVTAAYGFEAWCMNQNVYVTYQRSGDAGGVSIPRKRWGVGYGIDVWKNTSLTAEYDQDYAYRFYDGGENNSNGHLVSLRAAVKFG